MSHDERPKYLLEARSRLVFLKMQFAADNDEQAILDCIDIILSGAERNADPWCFGEIRLSNAVGVELLGIPTLQKPEPFHG